MDSLHLKAIETNGLGDGPKTERPSKSFKLLYYPPYFGNATQEEDPLQIRKKSNELVYDL